MEITSALAFLVSGVSLALALITVSLNLRAVRKTDLEILQLKHDLNEASSRIYVPTSEEILALLDTIKISEQMSRNLYESAREHIAYYKTSNNQQSLSLMQRSESLEDSIRTLEGRLCSVTSLLEDYIHLRK
jgi:hypothetical protein